MNKNSNHVTRNSDEQSTRRPAAEARTFANHASGAAASKLSNPIQDQPYEPPLLPRNWVPDFSPPMDEDLLTKVLARRGSSGAAQEDEEQEEEEDPVEQHLKKATALLQTKSGNQLANEARLNIRALLNRAEPGSFSEFEGVRHAMCLARFCTDELQMKLAKLFKSNEDAKPKRVEFANPDARDVGFKLAQFFNEIGEQSLAVLTFLADRASPRPLHELTCQAIGRLQRLRSNSHLQSIAAKCTMWPAMISKHPFVTRQPGKQGKTKPLNEQLLDALHLGVDSPIQLPPRKLWDPSLFENKWVGQIVEQIQFGQEWVQRERQRAAMLPPDEREKVLSLIPDWMMEAEKLHPNSGWEAWWGVAWGAIREQFPDHSIATLDCPGISKFRKVKAKAKGRKDNLARKVSPQSAEYMVQGKLRRAFKTVLRAKNAGGTALT